MQPYVVYFRRRRGTMGIPFDLALTELKVVFEPYGLKVDRQHVPKHRVWVSMDLHPKAVPQFANHLAYTEAILSQRIEAYGGGTIAPIRRGRWVTGWVRQGDFQIYQEEVFVQDFAHRRKDSPDQQTYEIIKNGRRIQAKGYHARRALSALDARFLFNVAQLGEHTKILDPFAGFGGIVREGLRRNMKVFATDIDATLSMGLQDLTRHAYARANARALPFPSHTFDAVITEPPFHPRFHEAIYHALPELVRITRTNGKLVLLIAQNMLATLQGLCGQHFLKLTPIGTLPRDHGLRCPALIIESLTP
ncbi:MAG: methyltransferase domain-containing protein [bacterium]|nr:methyltransferase domain-containing protein [bacterium]